MSSVCVPERSGWSRYGIAVAVVVLVTLLRASLDGVLGNHYPFLLFLGAVVFAAWYGGRGPGLLATLGGAVAAVYFFVPLHDSLQIHQLEHQAGLLLYLVACTVLTALITQPRPPSLPLSRMLNENDSIYRHIVEEGHEGVCIVDNLGAITYVNPRFVEMLGYSKEEMLGHYILAFIFPEDFAKGLAHLTERLVSTSSRQIEFRGRRKNGSVLWVLIETNPLYDGQGQKIGVLGMYCDITNRKRIEGELQRLNETLEQQVASRTAVAEHRADQLRHLAAELTQAEHRERRRVSKMLHDHLQQLLVAAKMRVGGLEHKAQDDGLRTGLRQIRQLLEQSLAESRSLTVQLSPPILYDRGLIAGLEWLARYVGERHDLPVTVEAQAEAEPDEDATRVLLFEIARELLLNTVKHAQATKATIELRRLDDDSGSLTVSDNGRGFDPADFEQHETTSGFGLFSIRERVELLGGRVEVVSRPEQGTRVMIRMPLVKAVAAAAEARAAGVAGPSAPAAPGRLRVLLADDHPIVRKGLADILAEQPQIELVGEASDGQEAVDLAIQTRPDVVMMDVSMPRLSGIEATRRIRAALPEVRVIGLSMHVEADMAAAMDRAGAVAYLRKDAPPEVLTATIFAQTGAV